MVLDLKGCLRETGKTSIVTFHNSLRFATTAEFVPLGSEWPCVARCSHIDFERGGAGRQFNVLIPTGTRCTATGMSPHILVTTPKPKSVRYSVRKNVEVPSVVLWASRRMGVGKDNMRGLRPRTPVVDIGNFRFIVPMQKRGFDT